MYTSTKNQLEIEVSMIQNESEMAKQLALIDSGAMDNFLDWRTKCKYNLRTQKLPYLQQLYNVDGSDNRGGMLEEYCVLSVTRGKKTIPQMFYVTELGGDKLILGYPWLEQFDPWIQWSAWKIYGPETTIQLPEWTELTPQ